MKTKLAMLSFFLAALCLGEGEEVFDYLDVMKIGAPVSRQNLRIFPIQISRILDRSNYLCLDEGLKRGYLKIKEVGSGSVNEVQVRNTSGYKIFIMTGEVIVGAKQDRMLKEDVLLPSNSGFLSLPVYCTEHGRWTEVSKEFKSDQHVAPGTVRQRAKASESQAEVWDEIAGTQSRLKVAAPTQALRAVYDDKEIQRQSKPYIGHFSNLPRLSGSTIGVVVTVGGRIVCVDLFANHSLLTSLWSKLLKSYALDAIQGDAATVSKQEVEDFIDGLEDADFGRKDTPGLGRLVEISTDDGVGSALLYRGGVIHLDLFPKLGSPKPGSQMNFDFRRQQRDE